MSRSLVFYLAFALAFIGCSSVVPSGADAPAVEREDPGAAPEVRRLKPAADGSFEYYSGFTEPARLVVRDPAGWADAWARIYDRVAPRPQVAPVDFAREMVLLAALGERSSGGFTIVVDSVHQAGGELRALVRRIRPGAECGVTGALTQPVDAVLVPRSDLPVRWTERDEVRDCR